jgi:hypothetical protein
VDSRVGWRLPTEDKGDTFESCRVRQFSCSYSAICAPGLKLRLSLNRTSKQSGGKSFPNIDSLATRAAATLARAGKEAIMLALLWATTSIALAPESSARLRDGAAMQIRQLACRSRDD